MYKNLVLVLVGACTALACLLGTITSPVHAATLPAGFSESIVFSGLERPTAVRFSPDGRVFVAEKSGLIKVFATLSATSPTIFHDLRTNVHYYWDRGLMGLELHPNFPTIPSVYVLYTYNKDPNNAQVPRWGTSNVTSSNEACPTPPGPTTDGCVVSGRLSRLEVSSGSNVSTGTESVLVEGWGQQFPSHSMDTVKFGPDGALYASAGEGASWEFADYGQRGIPLNPLGDPPVGIGGVQTPPTAEGGRTRAQSLRRVSGPAVLNGTLIRVDPFTGAGLSDNPLFANADPNARRIVAYGLRNPFRFTFRPGTNDVWIGDVGMDTWEEIDRIPDPLTPTVRNFGWPCYEGAGPEPSYQALGLNICQSLYSQAGGHTVPYFTYNHSQQVVAGETCPTGSSSISGLAFNQGGTYPASYQGALFFADHSLHEGQAAVRMEPAQAKVDVRIAKGDSLKADHVILATGYAVDIDRLTMIDPSLRADIEIDGTVPTLNAWFESTVPGLYFVGLTSLRAFGPLCDLSPDVMRRHGDVTGSSRARAPARPGSPRSPAIARVPTRDRPSGPRDPAGAASMRAREIAPSRTRQIRPPRSRRLSRLSCVSPSLRSSASEGPEIARRCCRERYPPPKATGTCRWSSSPRRPRTPAPGRTTRRGTAIN